MIVLILLSIGCFTITVISFCFQRSQERSKHRNMCCSFATYFTEEYEIISQQLTYNFEYNSAGYIPCISISENNEKPTHTCGIQQSEQFYSPCLSSTSDPSSFTNFYEWNGTGTHYLYVYPSDTVVINSSLFVFIGCVTFLIAFFALVLFAFLKIKSRNATANQQRNLL